MAKHDDDFDDDTPAPRRLRIIPLTMTMLSLMFVVQMNEIYNDSLKLREFYGVRDARAAEEKPAEAKTEEKKADAPKEEAKTDAKTDVAPDTAVAKDVKESDVKDAKADEKSAEGEHGSADAKAKPPEEPRTFGTGKSTIKEIEAMKAKDTSTRYTQNELDLLENLGKRRDELDQRERDLVIKAKVLDATEKRINDKLVEMKTLETSLSKVVATYNEKQSAQIDSLVKIYQNMKPVDAAGIFNQLDMPILLEVIHKMSERKVSPILAAMDPKKARDVTEELAAMRRTDAAPAGAKKPGQSK